MINAQRSFFPAVPAVDECIINAHIFKTKGHAEVVSEATMCFCVRLFYDLRLEEYISNVSC